MRDPGATPRVRPRPKFKRTTDEDDGPNEDVTPKATRTASKKPHGLSRSTTGAFPKDRQDSMKNMKLSKETRKGKARAE